MKHVRLIIIVLLLCVAAIFLLRLLFLPEQPEINFVFSQSFTSSSVGASGEAATVIKVIDGDTIDVRLPDGEKKRVRFVGIDTPETVDSRKKVQCYGAEASDRMKTLLSGASVTLSPKPDEDMDDYGRLLRYVFLDGRDIGEEMIAGGYAVSLCNAFPHPKCAEYDLLEKQAREERVGRWGACR